MNPQIEKDILELQEVKNDIPCFEAAKTYKTYNTIRRDLREAYDIYNYVINLNQKIQQNPNLLDSDGVGAQIFLNNAALMYAVVIYGRWFFSTNGKTTLEKKTFFSLGSDEEKSHELLITIRNKYAAHYEVDIFGSDKVLARFEDGKFIGTSSKWEKALLPDIHLFKTCIEIVHNKIDAEILPMKQKKLDEHLKRVYGTDG